MARNQETIKCPNHEWTELTNADVTEITFETTVSSCFIRVTPDANPPTEKTGFSYPKGTGESCIALNVLAKAGGARVWAKPENADFALIVVDHA